jgi:hypothetical protein
VRRELIALALAFAACGGDQEPPAPAIERPAETTPAATTPPADAEPPAAEGIDPSTAAINSLSVDPKDGTIVVGTGLGLFRAPPGAKTAERVDAQFSAPEGSGAIGRALVVRFAGPGVLLGSGHPERAGALPENLGLVASTDGGDTWAPRSGMGDGDYHEIEAAGDTVLVVNADSPDILVSRDGGRSFPDTSTPPAPPIDLVIDPADGDHWAVSTEQGTFLSTNGGRSWRPRDPTFGARLIWPAPDALYSVDRNGTVRVSRDGGRKWEDRGEVGGLPAAAAAGRKGELLVAVVGGEIRRSRDGGKSWATAVTLG